MIENNLTVAHVDKHAPIDFDKPVARPAAASIALTKDHHPYKM